MIRRSFLQSLLGALGLAVVPKAQAKMFPNPYVAPYPVEWDQLVYMHQHEPKVDYYNDVVVYGMRNGRPICQLIAQHAIVTQRTYGAAIKTEKGVVTWKSPPPYRTESEVSLSGLFGPAPLMSTLAAIFGDVMKAKELSLVLVEPEGKKRVDISYALLANVGCGVGSNDGTMWSGCRFLGYKVEEKHDQWQASDLDFIDRHTTAHNTLDPVGLDWKYEQELFKRG